MGHVITRRFGGPKATTAARDRLESIAEMDKEHILDEIRRTAKENGGSPLGQARFQQQTGIKEGDWFGRRFM